MDVPRMIGIAVVMIIPAFVVGGAIWSVSHSWIAIMVWVVLMAGFTAGLIRTLFFSKTSLLNPPGIRFERARRVLNIRS